MAFVGVQRALAEAGVQEDDDQVHRVHARGGCGGLRMEQVAAAVRLPHLKALAVDLVHHLGVDVHHRHVVFAAEIGAVQPAHRAGAQYNNSHGESPLDM